MGRSLPPWLQRVGHFVPAVACVFLALVLAGAGSNRDSLACERDTGGCTWSSRSFFTDRERAFAIAAVREVRFVDDLGKRAIVTVRFQGAECLPGGGVRMSLDEGTYPIEIWAPSGPDRWLPRTLSVKTGETTRFVCAP